MLKWPELLRIHVSSKIIPKLMNKYRHKFANYWSALIRLCWEAVRGPFFRRGFLRHWSFWVSQSPVLIPRMGDGELVELIYDR